MGVVGRALCIGFVAALAATSLAACRDEEQGRPLSFKKGVYEGAKDETVTADAVKSMGDRVKKQQF